MSKTTVNLIAFDISFSKNIVMDDFYYWMELLEKKDIKSGGYTCKIMSKLKDGYIVGLILSYKGDKKIIATRDENSELVIDQLSLSSDQNSTQASIFCLEPASQSGLFYSYHNGISVGLIGDFFKKIHDKARLEKIKSKKFEKPNKDEKKIRAEFFPGEFNLRLKITEADIKTIMVNMADVNSVDITMGPAVEQAPIFRSLIPYANKFSTKVSLQGKQSPENKIGAVKSLWSEVENKASVTSFRVWGKSLTGKDISLKVGENINHFGDFHFDDFIEMLPQKKWVEFIDCKALEVILEKIRKNVAVFPKPKSVETWKYRKSKAELIAEVTENEGG